MDASLSSPVLSKFQASFRENKQSFGIRRKSGYTSPVFDMTKFSGLLNLKKDSSGISIKIPNNEPDFYEEITKECNRLDPNFKISNNRANCYSFILELIRRSVDLILSESQKNLRNEINLVKKENFDIKSEFEKLNAKIVFYQEKDNFLTEKEEKLKKFELKLVTDQKLLQNEKNQLKSLKKFYTQLDNEVKTMRENLKSQQKAKKINKFKVNRKELYSLSAKNAESFDKNSFEYIISEKNLQETIFLSKLEENQETTEKPNDSLEHLKSPYEAELKLIEKSEKEMENIRIQLKNEENHILQEKEALKREKEMIIKDQNALKLKIEKFEKEKLEIQKDKIFIKDFQNSITSIEKELFEKESQLADKEAMLETSAKELEKA